MRAGLQAAIDEAEADAGNMTPSRWDMDYAGTAWPGWRRGPSPWFFPALMTASRS